MTVLSDLEKLHSAEDFFAYLQVPNDPALLHVARLHILKRMGRYLAEQDFSGMDEEAVFAQASDMLARAYADFAASRPIDERVFKVLQEHDPSRPKVEASAPRAFVALAALTIQPDNA